METLELYNRHLESFRGREYPQLKDVVYLDHAGTTLYAKSLIDRFSVDMISNLYGNPHSASPASQNTARRIDDTRLRLLRFFNADPDDFDIVFTANATASIKLVMEAFRDQDDGFKYGYHKDSHTSLVGVREVAAEHKCFVSDTELREWLNDTSEGVAGPSKPVLVAYPAQSNMNGRRMPLDWCGDIRIAASRTQKPFYTLLDAAALVSTSPLNLSDATAAPDFTVLSFYKIFGFPDLGALIVRKASAGVFQRRKYFGGGTVDMVVCLKEQWHAKKSESLHELLEDGTLPIHNIVAVDSAMDVHQQLFGSIESVSLHTSSLAKKLYDGLDSLRHGNNLPLCEIYKDTSSTYGEPRSQGPTIAFNVKNSRGAWVSNFEVEKLASIQNIQLRTGGLCNPGGVASSLGLQPWEMKKNFSAGQRCGNESDVMGGKPTGMIRLSLGAMSTIGDVHAFLGFMQEFFVEETPMHSNQEFALAAQLDPAPYHVESLAIYPIKSCAGWRMPRRTPWQVRKEGLAWDREWCVVHQGTGAALSQKRYPRMALLRPSIDVKRGVLCVKFSGIGSDLDEVVVPLSQDPRMFSDTANFGAKSTKVCGDTITAHVYGSPEIADFFTRALEVPCQLARFPAARDSALSSRHAKAHLQPRQDQSVSRMPGTYPGTHTMGGQDIPRPILLSNESPILTISRSSLNRLNEQIKAKGGKAVPAEVFRANIVIAEDSLPVSGIEQPYVEDTWLGMQIGQQYFRMLGSCRRCQMVCVDPETAARNQEPFSTLAKTRRLDGKVFFGQHTCHVPVPDKTSQLSQNPTITVGDAVRPIAEERDFE